MAPRGDKLAELSRELSGVAERLQMLAHEGAHPTVVLTPQLVRLVLAMRLMAAGHFAPRLDEPARRMLLVLYAAKLERRTLTLSRLTEASAVRKTSALRWLDVLNKRGFVWRFREPKGYRRLRVALTPDAVAGVEAYLAAIFERPFLLP